MLTQASCISLFPMSSEQKYMDLLSLSHSHLSSHLSIISFLLSVNCSNFSLICAQKSNNYRNEKFSEHWYSCGLNTAPSYLHISSVQARPSPPLMRSACVPAETCPARCRRWSCRYVRRSRPWCPGDCSWAAPQTTRPCSKPVRGHTVKLNETKQPHQWDFRS